MDQYNHSSDNAQLQQAKSDARNLRRDDGRMELYDWVQCIITALVAGILIFLFVGRVIGVKGPSMMMTLLDGDRLITSNLFYHPQQGDIVVVQTDTFGSEPIVKRVIATEGQTVDIDFTAGIVYVDGKALDEPYVNTPTNLQEDFTGAVTVPEGCLFLMGDNRNSSTDSRDASIGMVDERCVIGKVYFVLIPGSVNGSRDWSRFGSVY